MDSDIQKRFDAVSGVQYTNSLEIDGEPTLQVAWEGRPHDYLSSIQMDDLEQVAPGSEYRTKNPDGMPITYYQVRDL